MDVQGYCKFLYQYFCNLITYKFLLSTQNANWSEPLLHRGHWSPTLLTVGDHQVEKCEHVRLNWTGQKHRMREHLQTTSHNLWTLRNLTQMYNAPQINSNLLCNCCVCWSGTTGQVKQTGAWLWAPPPETVWPMADLKFLCLRCELSAIQVAISVVSTLCATVPCLFPTNRLPLYNISMLPARGGGGAAAEGRKKGRLEKQSLYSRLSSRTRPSHSSGVVM